MKTYITDGTYTYNLYRNNNVVASNLTGSTYTDSNLPDGFYDYHVTTNYFGGESDPSNTVHVQVGNPTYTITATVNPTGGGTITGGGTYNYNQSCTVTATPGTGYTFLNWTEDGEVVCSNATYTFTVMSNRVLVANFEFSTVTQTTPLAAGWNWWSTNLEITLDDLKAALIEALPGTAITISSKAQNTTYNPNNHRWFGRLTWDLSQMYRIQVASACEIVLQGSPINPSEHHATVLGNGQYTYIAFPLSESMTLNQAFAGFAVDGDIIQSKGATSLYNRGRWQGTSFTTLEPGQGYIYKSNSTQNRTFVFPR